MNVNNPLYQFIQENKDLLEKGEVLTVLFHDCHVTVFNEIDKETSTKKTITLVDPCDKKIDCNLSKVIEME